MINFLWMCVILLEAGISAVRAIPVQCTMSNNKVSEAGNWPDTVGTYHNDLDWTELRYYRLRCEFSSNPRTFPREDLFRVYHDHWRRPFERADCEHAGCIPVIWKSNSSFSNGQPIIDVYWSNVIQFATTAPQLKVCQINAANQSSITFTTSQLNDLSVCQPSGRFNVSGPSNGSNTTVKDFFMHVSSDMFTEQEIERVNNGENVIVTIDKDCSAGYRFRDGCDIMLLASPYSRCDVDIPSLYYTARPDDRGLELTEIFDKNGLIAYKYRMTTYKLYYGVYSNLTEGRFVIDKNMISHKPVDFVLSCTNSKLYTPFRDKIVKRFTLITLYWPNITIDIRSGDRKNKDFYIGKGQEAVFDVRIVSSNNVTAFQMKGLERDLERELNEGEVVIKPKVYYPYNYTTLYSIIILPRSNHESYRIFYRVQEINVELTTLFYLTIKQEIEMAVNPMKIVVVRGDRSVRPYFVCAAISFPLHLTLVWSKEIGALQAKQSPVGREILPPGITRATYLQFPPATALTSEYNGEYTCTASSPHPIASKKVTAILVVLEPGSYYSLFQPHWIPTDLEEPGDIIVTNQEKAYFDCIDQPIITEPGKLSCTHSAREDSTTTVVRTMIGLSTSIMAVATISLGVVLSYRWYKKHMQIPDDASSNGEALITTSSNEAIAESTVDNEEDSDWGL